MRWGNEALNTLHCHGDTFAHKVRHFLVACHGSSIMGYGRIIMLAICLCAMIFQSSPQWKCGWSSRIPMRSVRAPWIPILCRTRCIKLPRTVIYCAERYCCRGLPRRNASPLRSCFKYARIINANNATSRDVCGSFDRDPRFADRDKSVVAREPFYSIPRHFAQNFANVGENLLMRRKERKITENNLHPGRSRRSVKWYRAFTRAFDTLPTVTIHKSSVWCNFSPSSRYVTQQSVKAHGFHGSAGCAGCSGGSWLIGRDPSIVGAAACTGNRVHTDALGSLSGRGAG